MNVAKADWATYLSGTFCNNSFINQIDWFDSMPYMVQVFISITI